MSRRLRASAEPRPRPSGPVTTVKVDPRVWRTALRLAGGDVRRLTVNSATNVVVEPPRR